MKGSSRMASSQAEARAETLGDQSDREDLDGVIDNEADELPVVEVEGECHGRQRTSSKVAFST